MPGNTCAGVTRMMRYLSILALGAAFLAAPSAFPLTLAHAAEDGVICEKRGQGWIECTVNQAAYSVGSVSINDGNCPSPIPSEAELPLAKHFNVLFSTGNKKLVRDMPPMMNIMGYFSDICLSANPVSPQSEARNECPGFLAWLKQKNNPTGDYKLADHFRVATFGCDDVTEMTIRATDGTSKTWDFSARN